MSCVPRKLCPTFGVHITPRGIAPKTPQARAATTALVRVGIAERQRFLPNPKIKKLWVKPLILFCNVADNSKNPVVNVLIFD
jgi:hypothetical protein